MGERPKIGWKPFRSQFAEIITAAPDPSAVTKVRRQKEAWLPRLCRRPLMNFVLPAADDSEAA
jgi:hypothetical protein